MNRKNATLGVLLAVAVLAACSSQGALETEPAPAGGPPPGASAAQAAPPAASPTSPTAPPAATPEAALAVPREFTCDASAVKADTMLVDVPAAPGALILRPSGTPCSNHLVFQSGTSPEHVLSKSPGMIVLADAAAVGPSLVACLSNERHSPSRGGAPNDRYSDGTVLECAVRTASGWSATIAIVAASPDYAAWIVAVRPDEADPAKLSVRWLRDSKFQFLHMVAEDRPATDGVYETQLTVKDGALLIGTTTKRDGAMFESTDVAPPLP